MSISTNRKENIIEKQYIPFRGAFRDVVKNTSEFISKADLFRIVVIMIVIISGIIQIFNIGSSNSWYAFSIFLITAMTVKEILNNNKNK